MPFIIYMLYLGWTLHPAALFTSAALTDWLDGWIARKYNSHTEFGKLFDPLTDRIFIASTIIALYVFREVPPLWAVIVLAARDVVLMLGGQLVYKRTGRHIPINFAGKLATTVLMFAVVFMILGWGIGTTGFYGGLLLSLIAAVLYLNRLTENS